MVMDGRLVYLTFMRGGQRPSREEDKSLQMTGKTGISQPAATPLLWLPVRKAKDSQENSELQIMMGSDRLVPGGFGRFCRRFPGLGGRTGPGFFIWT